MSGDVLESATALVAGLDPGGLSEAEVATGLAGLHVLAQVVTARILAFLRVADECKLHHKRGAAHVVPWAASTLKVSRRAVSRLRGLDRSLDRVPLVRQAFAAGKLTEEQARLIADAIAVLPAGAEELILNQCAEQGPEQLKVTLRELQEKIDPWGTQRRDEDAAAQAEKRARARAGIRLYRLSGTNMARIEGFLDVVRAAAFLSAMDALCAPRNQTTSALAACDPATCDPATCDPAACVPAACDPAACVPATCDPAACVPAACVPADPGTGDAVQDDPDPATATCSESDNSGDDEHGPDAAASPLGAPDLRSVAQRRHDAICEIGRRIHATTALPDHGGDRPQAVVTVTYEALRKGIGSLGYLDDGTPLTPAACRRWACDAMIIPAVLGGESQPLDLGRSRRHFNAAIRRALKLRDRGCSFPECDRPASWCEAHHATPWHAFGPSDLSNAALVCHFHHDLLHHSGWTVRINPRDGRPDYFAPEDPTPRRNFYHPRT